MDDEQIYVEDPVTDVETTTVPYPEDEETSCLPTILIGGALLGAGAFLGQAIKKPLKKGIGWLNSKVNPEAGKEVVAEPEVEETKAAAESTAQKK